ncbi:MAG: class I SAM-dependent methyltransferase [Defluviitaleaceae bacterium]|nr:class I SAM-dependent methyltransferase [Defluviitaleaceae bacterium]
MILTPGDWKDYELIDASDGEKLERFGDYLTVRPDPQVIWNKPRTHPGWRDAQLYYHRSAKGGGSWETRGDVPERWELGWNGLRFHIRPTDFKHMGIFPEQAVNWRWAMDRLREAREPRVLNLFAYTGGATLAAAAVGARVCHVDAAKAMNGWAKENLALSGLGHSSVRFITDDVMKFVAREKRRGSFYDAIIMDPPAYGRGPKGELWKLENELPALVSACAGILSEKPLFMLVNVYTAGISPVAIGNLLRLQGLGGQVEAGEIGLKSASGLILPCGVYGRVCK